MFPNLLEQSDLEILEALLLNNQSIKRRRALCLKIGIDPKQLSFIRDSSDSDFVIELIHYINDLGNKQALCKLCLQQLYPLFPFNKSQDIAILERLEGELERIAVKLECPQKLITLAERKKKFLINNIIFVIVLTVFVLIVFSGYKYIPNVLLFKNIENTLKNKQWKLADQKTTEMLLREAGRNDIARSEKEDVKLNEKEIQTISCPVLLKLNKLWESNSQGRFGFRKQNSIWKSANQKNWDEFGDRVGWRAKGEWTSISFTKTANEGHLPSFIYVPNSQISWDDFFDHVEECGLNN